MAKVLAFNDVQKKVKKIRAERYACQSVARLAIPEQRVSKCLRSTLSQDVEIWKHKQTEKAFYSGLQVCGSVWHCPVCASKISERRRKELKSAYDIHLSQCGQAYLLTLTFSHQKSDRLQETLKKFGQATNKFMSGKRYDNIRKRIGLIGRVRAFEITYGSNGFHPHTHTVLFCKNKVNAKKLEKELYDLWEKACNKYGLTTKEKYGLTLENAEKANDYLAKHGSWSLEQEMTKSHIKKAKKDSMTPFDFLRRYLETEDSLYLHLFKEYAEAMKGKRQLQWSQGLKKLFLIEEKTDEEVAKEKIEEADLLGYLNSDQWKFILKHDMRVDLLDYVEEFGFDKAVTLINKKKTPIHSIDAQNDKLN